MIKEINWAKYQNFTKTEFDCKETGENEMQAEFMDKLQALRVRYGKPMRITSGYRSPKHSIEAKKTQPGSHAQGVACDIACSGYEAYEIVKIAFELGFSGIGISQKASGSRFVHLDIAERISIWGY